MFKELNILKMFFEEPNREFNVREVARILGISPATASKELKKMAKGSLLKERKERMLKLYRADLESELYRDLKTFYNIRKLKDSGLIEGLNKYYLKPSIVLFGSAAHGLDTETSDFDLLIVSERKKEFPSLKVFEKKVGRGLQLFVVKDIRELRNENLINNIANGTMLQGGIKWT